MWLDKSWLWSLSVDTSVLVSILFVALAFKVYREYVSGLYLANLFMDSVEIKEKDLYGSLVVIHLLFMTPVLNLFFILPLFIVSPILIILCFSHIFKLELSDNCISYMIIVCLAYGIIITMLGMGIWSIATEFRSTLKKKYKSLSDDTDLNLKEFNELNSNDKFEHTDYR